MPGPEVMVEHGSMTLLEAPGPVWVDGELHAHGSIPSEVAVLMGTALGMSPACHLRGTALLDEHLSLLIEAAVTLGYDGVDPAQLRVALAGLGAGEQVVVALVPGPVAHRAAPPGEDWSLVRWPADPPQHEPIDAPLSATPRNHLSPVSGTLLLDDTELLAGSRAAAVRGGDACLWTDLDGRLSCLDRGALVLRAEGRLVTPAEACGAVRTAWRQALVEVGALVEAELRPDDLARADSASCLQPWGSAQPVWRAGGVEYRSHAASDELQVLLDELVAPR
jgi:branched-subunit amino acid aminotransferase/4-amino-4-deoxychorismate lyase